jgi:ketosteroid isomerase-like protein
LALSLSDCRSGDGVVRRIACRSCGGPPRRARAEVAPLLAEMGAAANAHDVERHVGLYAHDPSVTLIYNGQAIVGWEAIRDEQAQWWKNGKTDVVYTMQGPPEIRVAGPDLVITTIYMTSRRTMPGGEVRIEPCALPRSIRLAC